MGNVELIRKNKRETTCNHCRKIIPIGDTYYKEVLPQREPIIRCLACGLKRYEITTSNYSLRVDTLLCNWKEMFEYGPNMIQDIIDELNSILEDCQYRLHHLSEQAPEENTSQIWQKRIHVLEKAISELHVSCTWDDFIEQGYHDIPLRDPDEPFEVMVEEIVDEMNERNMTKYADFFDEFVTRGNYLADAWKNEVQDIVYSIILNALYNFL